MYIIVIEKIEFDVYFKQRFSNIILTTWVTSDQ